MKKKKRQPLAVQFAACSSALAALASALIANVDPVSCLVRGAIAYVVARFLAGFWCALFTPETVENSGGPIEDAPVAEGVEEQDPIAA